MIEIFLIKNFTLDDVNKELARLVGAWNAETEKDVKVTDIFEQPFVADQKGGKNKLLKVSRINKMLSMEELEVINNVIILPTKEVEHSEIWDLLDNAENKFKAERRFAN